MQIIGEFVRTLPRSPGVYRMLAANGDVLYVGKARNLRKRVADLYPARSGLPNRCAAWLPRRPRMEVVTTHTEVEALLLESNLIKR